MRACGGEGELYTFENRGEAQHVSSLPSAGALSGEGDREGGKRVRRGGGWATDNEAQAIFNMLTRMIS